jgi:hypothetical protein
MSTLPSISQSEMRLLLPTYFKFLREHMLEDTAERLELATVMWAAGGASTLRRSSSIGSTAPTMRELADLLLFADLVRESENGSAYWSTTPEDVADELGVHD